MSSTFDRLQLSDGNTKEYFLYYDILLIYFLVLLILNKLFTFWSTIILSPQLELLLPSWQWQPVLWDEVACTWVTVEGRVMLAVAACEASGAAALVQAALRVLAGSSVLKDAEEEMGPSAPGHLLTCMRLCKELTWQGWSLQVGQLVTPVELRSRSLKITSSPWMTSWRMQPALRDEQRIDISTPALQQCCSFHWGVRSSLGSVDLWPAAAVSPEGFDWILWT